MTLRVYQKCLGIVLILLLCFQVASAQKIKKTQQQIQDEEYINAQRQTVLLQKSSIYSKRDEINAKQQAFDAHRARYLAEEERIKQQDAVVASRESCMSNLLADCLPRFATPVIQEYQAFRNAPSDKKKINDFKFFTPLSQTLQSSYFISHQEYISTFVDASDRATFNAKVKATFEMFFIGGKDQTGTPQEGQLSKHFHPKNLPPVKDLAQPLADKYVSSIERLNWATEKVVRMAKAMPIEFYVGWEMFTRDCGLPLTHVMKRERKKDKIREVEAQKKEGIKLREAFIHLEDLKAQLQVLETDLIPMERSLNELESAYLRLYKMSY